MINNKYAGHESMTKPRNVMKDFVGGGSMQFVSEISEVSGRRFEAC